MVVDQVDGGRSRERYPLVRSILDTHRPFNNRSYKDRRGQEKVGKHNPSSDYHFKLDTTFSFEESD